MNTCDLAIVLDNFSEAMCHAIIKCQPHKVIILDRAFSSNQQKANALLQFEDAGVVVGCV